VIRFAGSASQNLRAVLQEGYGNPVSQLFTHPPAQVADPDLHARTPSLSNSCAMLTEHLVFSACAAARPLSQHRVLLKPPLVLGSDFGHGATGGFIPGLE
jgi:hypothetical protein